MLNTCKWSDEPGLALGQSRERVSNTWVTCLDDRDNPRKLGLIPDVPARGKEASASASRWARGPLACWWGNGLPRLRWVAGLRGRSATLGLRHGPDSYGRQQWGILRNARKRDAATPRGGRRPVPSQEAPANYVPAAAVIRRVQALSGIIGRKERVGGSISPL